MGFNYHKQDSHQEIKRLNRDIFGKEIIWEGVLLMYSVQPVNFYSLSHSNSSYFVKIYNNSCLNLANYTERVFFWHRFLKILLQYNFLHELVSWQISCLFLSQRI